MTAEIVSQSARDANPFPGIGAMVARADEQRAIAARETANAYNLECVRAQALAQTAFGDLWAELGDFARIPTFSQNNYRGVSFTQKIDLPSYALFTLTCHTKPKQSANIQPEIRVDIDGDTYQLSPVCLSANTQTGVFNDTDLAHFFCNAQRITAARAKAEEEKLARRARAHEEARTSARERARQQDELTTTKASYKTAYAEFWAKWQAVQNANNEKLAKLQIELAGPERCIATYTLEYAVLGLDADDEKMLETRSVFVLDGEPDLDTGFWRVLSDCEGSVRLKRFFLPVSLAANPVYHILDAEIKRFAPTFFLGGYIDVHDEYEPLRYSPYFHHRTQIEQMLAACNFEGQPTPPEVSDVLDHYQALDVRREVEREAEEARNA